MFACIGRGRKRIFLLLMLVCLGLAARLPAEYLSFGQDLFINMPASWQVEEVGEEKFSALNQAGEAHLLVKYTDGGGFEEIETMYSFYLGELGAESRNSTAFAYSGNPAKAGSLEFTFNGKKQTGYMLCIETPRVDLVGVAFAENSHFPAYQDTLLSALDSISIGENGLMSPGPISQSASPYPDPDRDMFVLRFGEKEIPIALSARLLEASQEVIEREARVLVVYAGSPYAEEAWQRYYRIIYRDIYRRSRPIYTALQPHLSPKELEPREIAAGLLRWVQDFEYSRLENSVSDCLTPLKGAVDHTGDCDSRALLMTILLHYYGIDAVLMVSGSYGHSMVGVDVPGPGARFQYNGKAYLVAETTDQVDLGLIDQSMADASGWLGVDFLNTRILGGN